MPLEVAFEMYLLYEEIHTRNRAFLRRQKRSVETYLTALWVAGEDAPDVSRLCPAAARLALEHLHREQPDGQVLARHAFELMITVRATAAWLCEHHVLEADPFVRNSPEPDPGLIRHEQFTLREVSGRLRLLGLTEAYVAYALGSSGPG